MTNVSLTPTAESAASLADQFILSPIMAHFRRSTDNYCATAESSVLDSMRKYRSLFDWKILSESLDLISTPMLYCYILVLLLLLSLLLLPMVWCGTKKNKHKTLNAERYQCCFCLEGFALIMAIVALAMCIGNGVQVVSYVYISFCRLPIVIIDIAKSLYCGKSEFKEEVSGLVCNVSRTLMKTQHATQHIPALATYVIDDEIHPETSALLNYLRNADKSLFDSTSLLEVVQNEGKTTHIIESRILKFNKTLVSLNENISRLYENISLDQNVDKTVKEQLLQSIKLFKKMIEFDHEQYKFPNWSMICDLIDSIKTKHLVQLEMALPNPSHLEASIESHLHSLIDEFANKTANLTSYINNAKEKVIAASDILIPSKCLLRSASVNMKLEKAQEWLSFGGFSIIKTLMLSPLAVCFLILVLLVFCCFLTSFEVKAIAYRTVLQPNSIAVRVFGVVLKASALILWMFFATSLASFFLSMCMKLVCRPIRDGLVFDEFTDKISENNSTLIDTMLYTVFESSHQVKLRTVLKECSENKTIYKALNLSWNVRTVFEEQAPRIDNEEWVEHLREGIDSIEIDIVGQLNSMSDKLTNIQNGTFFPFEILTDVARFSRSNVSGVIQNEITNLPRNEKYDYVYQNLKSILLTANYEHQDIIEKLKATRDEIIRFQGAITDIESYIKESASNEPLLQTRLAAGKNNATTRVLKSIAELNTTLSNTLSLSIRLVEDEIGKCDFLPATYSSTVRVFCYTLPLLMDVVWLSSAMLGAAVLLCTWLCDRLMRYLRGVYKSVIIWRGRIEQQRLESLSGYVDAHLKPPVYESVMVVPRKKRFQM